MRNPYLLIRPFLRREAVLSSRIEDTQASLSNLFFYEASRSTKPDEDIVDVANYVDALEDGLDMVGTGPIRMDLINELHSVLLRDARGEHIAGSIRNGPVWIGHASLPRGQATYAPPPPEYLPYLLADWEQFVGESTILPPLIQCAKMHYQFEAIHPYFDGNGRMGRLLITLFLCAKGVLSQPLLYLSAYFERDRDSYYNRLLNVTKTDNWLPWIAYFLTGVTEQADDALRRARCIRDLHENLRSELYRRRLSGSVFPLLDMMIEQPVVTTEMVAKKLKLTSEGARRALNRLTQLDIVECHFDTWPHIYVLTDLLDILDA